MVYYSGKPGKANYMIEAVKEKLKKNKTEKKPNLDQVSNEHQKRTKRYKSWIFTALGIFIMIFVVFAVINIIDKPFDVIKVIFKAKKLDKNLEGYWEAVFRDDITMVYIPEGKFWKGSDRDDEKPFKEKPLNGYWMGKTEVTHKQYMEFVNETTTNYPQWLEKGHSYNIDTGSDNKYRIMGDALTNDNYPIVGIDWHNAKAYCDWLSKKTGLNFKLPTEYQWEKAARGINGRDYPWGGHLPYYNGDYYANYDPGNFNEDGYMYTAPVNSFEAGKSPYGLYNMAGNVWEWCAEWYNDSSRDKVKRGGSWEQNDFDHLRCAHRTGVWHEDRGPYLGFRLCMEN